MNNHQAAIRELDIYDKASREELAMKMRAFQVRGLALSATSDLPLAAQAFERAIAPQPTKSVRDSIVGQPNSGA